MIQDILDELNKINNKAYAWDNIDSRSMDAHDYCHKYLMPHAWGKNVWHAVLDDAIRMRKER